MAGQRTVERGAVVLAEGRVYTVVAACTAEAAATPASWPQRWRNDAVRAELRAHDDPEATYDAVLPREPLWPDGVVRVLASPDDEGHYPSCSKCGGPWPCAEVETVRSACRQVDLLLSHIEHEADRPWPCAWCGKFTGRRPRRFKTERGMKQHLRRCRENPEMWDASVWLHYFDDNIKIRGGARPDSLFGHTDGQQMSQAETSSVRFGPLDEMVAINLAVKRAALDGTLPARLSDLKFDL